MERYFGRIMRALIVSLLGFGGGMGLLVFIVVLVIKGDARALEYAIKAGVLLGGIFAALFVGVMLPLDLAAKLFLAKGNYRELWELEQTSEITFKGPLKEAIAYCRQALLVVPHVKAITEDNENLVFNASVGTSWRSGGELVHVEIDPIAEHTWYLRCTSRSNSKSVLFDYGKNFENVEAWSREVHKLMGASEQ